MVNYHWDFIYPYHTVTSSIYYYRKKIKPNTRKKYHNLVSYGLRLVSYY
jgi:hypothetical protein